MLGRRLDDARGLGSRRRGDDAMRGDAVVDRGGLKLRAVRCGRRRDGGGAGGGDRRDGGASLRSARAKSRRRRRRAGRTVGETNGGRRSSPTGPGIRASDARAPSQHGPRAPRNRLSQSFVGRGIRRPRRTVRRRATHRPKVPPATRALQTGSHTARAREGRRHARRPQAPSLAVRRGREPVAGHRDISVRAHRVWDTRGSDALVRPSHTRARRAPGQEHELPRGAVQR
mmetsp:Transcript_11276/g.47101  ORF Transcript_11276/g.47101 Transcript_11276/m.47101 type:complete len:229 (+) Transcript_11276:1340-2026(+)